jgi:hypothetical protein
MSIESPTLHLPKGTYSSRLGALLNTKEARFFIAIFLISAITGASVIGGQDRRMKEAVPKAQTPNGISNSALKTTTKSQ